MAVKENKGLLPHLSSSVCRFSFTQFTYALSAPRAPGMPATQRQPQRCCRRSRSGKRLVVTVKTSLVPAPLDFQSGLSALYHYSLLVLYCNCISLKS